MAEKIRKKLLEESLKNWSTFNENLLKWSIKELETMLKHEETNQNRSTFVRRIKQRLAQANKEKIIKDLK